jgi:AraC-like DNA-binding protein
MQRLSKADWFHEDGFPVVIERRDPQEPFGLHCHEFSEIVIITGGTGSHITGEESYPLRAGDTFVIGGDRPHDYVNIDGLSLINVLFDPNDLPLAMADLQSMQGYHALFTLEPAWRKRHEFESRLQLSTKELIEVTRLVDAMEGELHRRLPGFGVITTSLWLQLAAYLARCYAKSRSESSRSLLRLASVVSFLEQNYEKSIELQELVRLSGMPRRTFLRTFETCFGRPPITYLIDLRIRHACRLLQSTGTSITQIALQVGFNDSNYFSRKFHQITGITPREYRTNRVRNWATTNSPRNQPKLDS